MCGVLIRFYLYCVKTPLILFFPILLYSCGLLKTNKFLTYYKEVNDISIIENKIDVGEKYYPTVQEMENSNACIKEYQRLKSEGYILIGYSLFHNEGKMSQGLVIQAGMKLGAHKVLLSRELSHSGSLDNQAPVQDDKFKGAPILEALAPKPDTEKGSSKNNFLHNALFLVQRALE